MRMLPTREQLMRARSARFTPKHAGNTTLADYRAAEQLIYSNPSVKAILQNLGKGPDARHPVQPSSIECLVARGDYVP